MAISTQSFYNKIANLDIIENETFYLTDQRLSINRLKSDWVSFDNCIFDCGNLDFKNIKDERLMLEFKNCTFNCNVTFSDCDFDRLSFINTKSLKSLNLGGGGKTKLTLKIFQFSNDSEIDKPILTTDFSIRNTIIEVFVFENIKHMKGKFDFLGNTLGKDNNISLFQDSTITNVLFGKNSFSSFTTYKRVTFNTSAYLKPVGSAFEFPGFYKNTFVKISFSQSKFTGTFQFENCDFLSTTWFENCKNSNHSKLKFVACEFKGFSLFNKSKIDFLDIDRCTFDKSSSFTDAEFNTLKLFEVKFGGGAYFDEMKINKVLDKSYLKDKSKILDWKRTLRAIKQELQKTENKIDFNTYRNYELAAHYKELKLLKNFKDTSILWATKWSSNFGNWFWAFWFTILSGLLWYSILYRIENSGSFDFEKTNEFFVGAFRFFLVTDFFNPLENDRTYLLNGWSWLIFIMGKIFIAFGIYEMIQSFRKFKA